MTKNDIKKEDEKKLGYVAQSTYASLADHQRKEVNRFRSINGYIKRHQAKIVNLESEISKLNRELIARKNKVAAYKKEQSQIFDRYRRFTDDLLDFRIQLDDKGSNRQYYYLMFNISEIRQNKIVKRSISKYLGSKIAIKKTLKQSSSISDVEFRDQIKIFVTPFFNHHVQYDFDKLIEDKINIDMIAEWTKINDLK